MLSAEQIARAQVVSIANERGVAFDRTGNHAGPCLRRRAGAALCKTHGRAGVTFTLQPPGMPIKPRYAHVAIMSGTLTPLRDTLFGGSSQTWIYSASPTPPAYASAARARAVLTSAAAKDENNA